MGLSFEIDYLPRRRAYGTGDDKARWMLALEWEEHKRPPEESGTATKSEAENTEAGSLTAT